MKTFGFFAGFVVLAVLVNSQSLPIDQGCLKEAGIKQNDLAKLENQRHPKYDCYQACVVKKDGEIDARNMLVKSKVVENMVPLYQEGLDKCVDVANKGTMSLCARYSTLYKCMGSA